MDRKFAAMLGSFVFFWIAPAVVAGWIPWMLTRWQEGPAFWGEPSRWVGYVLITVAALALVESFMRFAVRGLGTPAPIAPTQYLVVSGLYRYVRNPMYVSVLTIVAGQAIALGSLVLVHYAAVLWFAFTAFVLLYEEPSLRRRFGASYDEYRANVGRWWPRRKPWVAPDSEHRR